MLFVTLFQIVKGMLRVRIHIYAYDIYRYEHRPYHCIHKHVSHTLYTIVECMKLVDVHQQSIYLCDLFHFVYSTSCITWIYTNVCKSE